MTTRSTPPHPTDGASLRRLPKHRRAATRLALTALAAVAGAALIPLAFSRAMHPLELLLFGYASGAATYLVIVGRILLFTKAPDVEKHAMTDDPGRTAVLLFILGSSAVVVGGAVTILRGGNMPDASSDILLALTVASTALAWLVTNAAFALHYAHLNFRDRRVAAKASDPEPEGRTGFMFPGDDPPDGMDFAYFSFTVGMTFQVSDVQVMTSRCRRTVLAHGMLAFAYNTLLIALVVNTALGRFNH